MMSTKPDQLSSNAPELRGAHPGFLPELLLTYDAISARSAAHLEQAVANGYYLGRPTYSADTARPAQPADLSSTVPYQVGSTAAAPQARYQETAHPQASQPEAQLETQTPITDVATRGTDTTTPTDPVAQLYGQRLENVTQARAAVEEAFGNGA